MFDWVRNAPLLPVKNKEIILYEKLNGPILWIGFNCLEATELLKGDSLLFTTQSPGVTGTNLIDLERMWFTLEPPSGFEPGMPGLGIQHSNHYGNWEDVC